MFTKAMDLLRKIISEKGQGTYDIDQKTRDYLIAWIEDENNESTYSSMISVYHVRKSTADMGYNHFFESVIRGIPMKVPLGEAASGKTISICYNKSCTHKVSQSMEFNIKLGSYGKCNFMLNLLDHTFSGSSTRFDGIQPDVSLTLSSVNIYGDMIICNYDVKLSDEYTNIVTLQCQEKLRKLFNAFTKGTMTKNLLEEFANSDQVFKVYLEEAKRDLPSAIGSSFMAFSEVTYDKFRAFLDNVVYITYDIDTKIFTIEGYQNQEHRGSGVINIGPFIVKWIYDGCLIFENQPNLEAKIISTGKSFDLYRTRTFATNF
jgi:hypothetical protein